MDLITALETRRSVRKYQEREIDRETIEKLIALATLAPSAMNSAASRHVVTPPMPESGLPFVSASRAISRPRS